MMQPHPYSLLAAMVGVPQDPGYHPEGDVWTHTLLTTGAASRIARREQLDPEQTHVLVLAGLLHDIGKPQTTAVSASGRITSHAHDTVGSILAAQYLEAIQAPEHLARPVVGLVREHMVYASAEPEPRTLRRLARRLARDGTTIEMLALLAEADASGRGTGNHAPMHAWVEAWKTLARSETETTPPIIKGRHLLALGMQPGPAVGQTLQRVYAAQLAGVFTDEAGGLNWLASNSDTLMRDVL